MSLHVEITFECLPLRTVGRFDIPVDAPAEHQAFCARVKQAADKHGLHNTYYLHDARCVFHLTNNPQLGLLEFAFEGTVLTDPDDRKTLGCDLQARLERETCPWLTEPIVAWFAETVNQAVRVEFDRFIAAGDLQRTAERIERTQAQVDEGEGFMGMGL